MLMSLLPDEVKVNVTIDVIKLKSNLKINRSLLFTKNFIFTQFMDLLNHIFILQTISMDVIY